MTRHALVRSSPLWLLVGAAFFLACGDDAPTEPEPFPGISVRDSLVFKLADSTAIAMGTTPLACCGLYDPSFVNERAMRIVLYDPAYQKPGWQILILIDRAVAGAATTLPTSVVAPSKVPIVSMHVASIVGEWSSDAEESSGTIVVRSFQCTATTIRIDFAVDAILGSELAGAPSLRAQGSFQAVLPAQSCTP